MILAKDIYTYSGILLAPKGLKANLTVRARLENYSERNEIDKIVRVYMVNSQISASLVEDAPALVQGQ